jgi:ABC-type polysaccharide/polyol phosphate transport system ATPase subunit
MEQIVHVFMKNSRIDVKNLTIAYRNLDSASKSFKMSLLRSINNERSMKIALAGVNFSVGPGEVLGILGRNGSGKSTLAKAITGIVKPYKGQVITRGLVTSIIELGAGLNQELTCRENILLHSAIYRTERKSLNDKIERICNWAGLEKEVDTPLKAFSSGMMARFSFSLLTDIKPDILILDEILSVGDIDFQAKSLSRTRELMDSGTSVLLISHNLNTIREFATRAIMLENGRIKSKGDVDLVCKIYEESYR